ncbi:uncharacterized protein isoform X3 [Rhodnius prolixus]|uniref:uncharacterized protein isoform X3 n=1 Tax=Rhodnius prolixus TaxID=13249 RepID=UPI003D18AE65
MMDKNPKGGKLSIQICAMTDEFINQHYKHSKTIEQLSRSSCPTPEIELRRSTEKLKLKIHRVIGTNGHKIYKVSAKDSNPGYMMADSVVTSEEGEEVISFKDEDIEVKESSEESVKDMDNAKESSDSTDSSQKTEQNECEPVNSTPISNGSKEGHDEPSTTLPQSSAEDDDEENNTGDSGVSSPGDSKKDVLLKSPTPKEVKREPVEPPKSPNGSDLSEAPTEPVQQPTLRVRRSDDLFERGEFENIDKLVQQPKQESGEELYMCSVCPDRFSTGAALEAHMARTGHYSISAHPEQPQSGQGPMQQLAQQVQRIPASFNSQSYRPDQAVPPYSQNAYAPQRINMLGPQVKLTPVGQSASPQSSSLPNLPPGIQLQKRPAQQNLENSQPKQRREELPSNPSVKLPSSITLVRPSQQSAPPKKPDNSVADILANRGITMIPSGGKAVPGATSMSRVPIPGAVSQLNSSVSITPSARSQQQSYAGRGLPTVDLTSDPDHPAPHHPMQQSAHHTPQQAQRIRNRAPTGMTPPHGRPPMRVSCQVCDKVFNSQEALNQHLPSHRGIHNKLPFECKECTAQYPTAQGLAVHKQKYHKTSSTVLDMAIPVVDLKQNGVLHKLTSLGVRNFIPLSQLHNQQNTGQFGLPIVSVELANNPAFCNISGIGASNLLPLGPLRNIPP